MLGEREDAVELAADAPLEAIDRAPVEPGAQPRPGAAGELETMVGRPRELVVRDHQRRRPPAGVDPEPGFQVFDVEDVEAAAGEQAVGGQTETRIRGGDARGLQGAGGRAPELLHVQAGQSRRERRRGGALARLHAGEKRHRVARGRPLDPLRERAAARVRGVGLRQEGADPENVHPTDRGPHLL